MVMVYGNDSQYCNMLPEEPIQYCTSCSRLISNYNLLWRADEVSVILYSTQLNEQHVYSIYVTYDIMMTQYYK